MKKFKSVAFFSLFAISLALASGCSGVTPSDTPDELPDSTPDKPALEQQSADDSTAQPAAPAGAPSAEISASHILVMYQGSMNAPAEITRSKEEALALAQELVGKAKAADADFAALAKENSDCPSSANGGNLGTFPPGAMIPEFSSAALELAAGEVSDVVETSFGYHVILRQEIKVLPKASAKHVLVQYAGSMRAPGHITRTKEEALARIEECLARHKTGDKFEDLAREYSDCPSNAEGGDLGEFPEGRMDPVFDKAAFGCEVGKITGIVETPFGYHVIYRYK